MAIVSGIYMPDRVARPGYLMRAHKTKGAELEIDGRLWKIKVYKGGRTIDCYTICCDGGELWFRPMYGGSEFGVWNYVGEMYIGDYFPGSHLGDVVDWNEMSESFKQSVINRLRSDTEA